jgi:phosphopantothenoylcysteine synthetase/decarboxylase
MNVLLGVTGSVAATLTRKLQDRIYESGHDVDTVITESANNFRPTGEREIENFWRHTYRDADEWTYYRDNKAVLHIDLVKWADIFVIAPCTANTLSKIEIGIADNLLTCCVRAWPYKDKRNIILAPAMNTCMWDTKHIDRQYKKLCLEGSYSWIPPVEKTLYCGDTGIGAMADIDTIIERIK